MKHIKPIFALSIMVSLLTGCDKNPLLALEPDQLAQTLNTANKIIQKDRITGPTLGNCNLYFADSYKEGDSFLSVKDLKKEFQKPCENLSAKLTAILKKETQFSDITVQQVQDKAVWIKYTSSKFAYGKKLFK